MKRKEFEELVTRGVYDMIVAILNRPENKDKRSRLLDQSSVQLCNDSEGVRIYVDGAYLPRCKANASRQTLNELTRDNFFASLDTPLVQITVSGGKVYSIVYPDTGDDVMPSEIDLEQVLQEVDRVAFTDKVFDKRRVLLRSQKRVQFEHTEYTLEKVKSRSF